MNKTTQILANSIDNLTEKTLVMITPTEDKLYFNPETQKFETSNWDSIENALIDLWEDYQSHTALGLYIIIMDKNFNMKPIPEIVEDNWYKVKINTKWVPK